MYDEAKIDHDHTTGLARGILCQECNTGIGKLGDSVEGLTKALEYLKRHHEAKAAKETREVLA